MVQTLNESVQERVAAWIEDRLAPGTPVAVLGLAYKANTPLVDESPSLKIRLHQQRDLGAQLDRAQPAVARVRKTFARGRSKYMSSEPMRRPR